MNTQKTTISTQETIFRVFVPASLALNLSRALIASNRNTLGEKWKEYNIQVFIAGFVNLEGKKVFQPECYSAKNLPLDTVQDFIVEISSFDEKTNPEILGMFTQNFLERFFKEISS